MAGAGDHALRRALARADAGKTLDAAEATALLGARGEALDALCSIAARVRDAGWMLPAARARSPTAARCSSH